MKNKQPDSSVVPTNRTKDDGHKLESVKFHLNTGKLFCYEDGQTLEQAAQRGCGVHLWRYLTGHSPGQPAPAEFACARELY